MSNTTRSEYTCQAKLRSYNVKSIDTYARARARSEHRKRILFKFAFNLPREIRITI